MTACRPAAQQRICVIGAGPCGLTALKNLRQVGCRNVVCYEESGGIGGNWAYTDDPRRAGVYECARTISSRRMASFDDFPMPNDYPEFPSHRQLLAYFTDYVRAFELGPYVRVGSYVERCELGGDGRWTVRVTANGETTTEIFDCVLVCSGHHREPSVPVYPGTFAGTIIHSSAYKRPDPFRGQRVLVVGAGNSAADIAVDVSRLASRTVLSVREGAYFVPKLLFGRPIDTIYAYWRSKLPKPLLRAALRLWLRLAIGRWQDYGLPTPAHAPLEKPPTVNSAILDALRHGWLAARPGIERYDGHTVHFTGGMHEEFDAIVMATGFRASFPFLPDRVADRDMYLNMIHPSIPSLFFIGLFQPLGCIWRLADYQARIAALQISGRLRRPLRIGVDVARPPHRTIEVDYHVFHSDLMRVLRTVRDDGFRVARIRDNREVFGQYQ
jgi:cation diffusion facilitator CzcD-associated flavoprotein CzcO